MYTSLFPTRVRFENKTLEQNNNATCTYVFVYYIALKGVWCDA